MRVHKGAKLALDVDEIYRANIGRLVARGSFTPPARAFPRGAIHAARRVCG